MADPNNFPGPLGQLQMCIIGSGGDPEKKGTEDGDFPTDQSCNQKLYSPTDHGSGVQLDHLNFSPLAMHPTQFGQQSFPGVMDPGTPVLVLKNLGSAGGIVLGQFNALQNPSTGAEGGSLMGSDTTFGKLKQRKMGINVPPKIKDDKGEDGVPIRKIEEKDEEHRFGLLEGLPIHGALFDMSGFRIPEIGNVPTAKQTNDGMMTQEMLGGLMGQVMSMGGMFQGLMGNRGGNAGAGGGGIGNNINSYNTGNNRLEYIQSKAKPEIGVAIKNLSILTQGQEVGNNGTSLFVTNVVDPNTYFQNAENLLLECQTLDDLMVSLNRLQYDRSLYGQENLINYETTIDTAWGTAKQVVDITGEISILYDANTLNAINTFSNTISSNASSPGIGSMPFGSSPTSSSSSGGSGGSSNMFGGSSQQMMEMFKRLHPGGEQNAKQMHEKLNTDQDSNKLFEIVKKTMNGGNPLDSSLFQG